MVIPRLGEKSIFVKQLQKALNRFGAKPKLVVDGDFGPATKKAVSRFQKKVGFKGSGLPGPKTMQMLGFDISKTQVTTEEFYNKTILINAAKELGVKEAKGKKNNPRVQKYLAYGSKNNDKVHPDSVPWCAGYIAFVLETSGLKSTDNLMARSYEGKRSGFKNVSKMPVPGDITTFYRNGRKSGSGHVAFFLKETPKYFYVVGGNQSDAVNVRRYEKTKWTGHWRPHTEKITPNQVAELRQIADNIISGKNVLTGGSVV